MTTYIYPQNLRAKANLWLWSLRDFLIMGIAALLSVVILVQTHIFLPAAATLLYGFLSIRLDDTTIIDFLRYAVKFFITTQQHFEWRQTNAMRSITLLLPLSVDLVAPFSSSFLQRVEAIGSYRWELTL